MPARGLDVTVRPEPRLAVLDLHGEMNGFAEQALSQTFDQAIAYRPTAILLNFADVDYINSTGIALIVTMMAQARQAGCAIMACGLSHHYVEIFGITRLADYMQLFPDEASARTQVVQEA